MLHNVLHQLESEFHTGRFLFFYGGKPGPGQGKQHMEPGGAQIAAVCTGSGIAGVEMVDPVQGAVRSQFPGRQKGMCRGVFPEGVLIRSGDRNVENKQPCPAASGGMVAVDMLWKYHGTVPRLQLPAFVHDPHGNAALHNKQYFAVIMQVLGKFQVSRFEALYNAAFVLIKGFHVPEPFCWPIFGWLFHAFDDYYSMANAIM